MKRLLRYLFIFLFAFMGVNSVVLAKDTVCTYSGSPMYGYEKATGNTVSVSYDIQITISDNGKKTTLDSKVTSSDKKVDLDKDDRYLKVENFINSNKKTVCPSSLLVATIKHPYTEYHAQGSVTNYRTGFYAKVGSFTGDELNEIESGWNQQVSPITASLVSSKNVGIKTSTKGDYDILQAEMEKPDKASPEELIGCGLLGEQTLNIIKKLFRFSRFGIPILVVILGLIDFLGIVFSGEEKNFKEAGNRFVKRLIAGVVVIFVPYILTMLINLSGIPGDYDLKTDELFCAFSDLETKTVGEQASESTRNVCQNQGSKESCDAKASSGCKWNEAEGSCYQEKSIGEQAENSTRNVCENLTDQDSCKGKQSLGCRWDTLSNECVKQ